LSDSKGTDNAVRIISDLQDSVSSFSYVEKCKAIDHFNSIVLKENVLSAVKLECIGIMKFFLGHSRWDVSYFLSGKEPDAYNSNISSSDVTVKSSWMMYFVFNVIINFLVFVAFLKFLFSKDLPIKLRGCIGSIVLYIALATGPSAASRFRLPIFPVLTVTFAVVAHRMTRKSPESAEFED